MYNYLEVIEKKSGTCIERVENTETSKKNLQIVNKEKFEVKEVNSIYSLKIK